MSALDAALQQIDEVASDGDLTPNPIAALPAVDPEDAGDPLIGSLLGLAAVVLVAVRGAERSMKIRADLLRLQDTTAQIRVRGAMVLLVGLLPSPSRSGSRRSSAPSPPARSSPCSTPTRR
jgi:hypothetical protein